MQVTDGAEIYLLYLSLVNFIYWRRAHLPRFPHEKGVRTLRNGSSERTRTCMKPMNELKEIHRSPSERCEMALLLPDFFFSMRSPKLAIRLSDESLRIKNIFGHFCSLRVCLHGNESSFKLQDKQQEPLARGAPEPGVDTHGKMSPETTIFATRWQGRSKIVQGVSDERNRFHSVPPSDFRDETYNDRLILLKNRLMLQKETTSVIGVMPRWGCCSHHSGLVSGVIL